MRAAATPIPLTPAERTLLIDTCGTGADASGTFNISTAAALVAAAAGATVAKHGNRRVTSECGSADVLEALGIPVDLSPAEGAASLRKHRFVFFHAPSLHPAMKTVMPVRRAIGIRTIFHLVGPLSNPAEPPRRSWASTRRISSPSPPTPWSSSTPATPSSSTATQEKEVTPPANKV